MKDLGFKFAEAHFCLAYPDELHDTVQLLLHGLQRTEPSRNEKAIEIIAEGNDKSYRIISDSNDSDLITGSAELIDEFPSFLQKEIVKSLAPGLILSGAALATEKKVILMPGLKSSNQSLLLSLLLCPQLHCLTDQCAYVYDDRVKWNYLRLPPRINSDVLPAVETLLGDRIKTHLAGSRQHHLILDQGAADTDVSPSLLIFSYYHNSARLSLTPLSSERAAEALLNCTVIPTESNCRQITEIARDIPAVSLIYGDISQLDHLGNALSYIAEKSPSAGEFTELLDSFQPRCAGPIRSAATASPEPAAPAIPTATPAGRKKVLTIGMATFDDYDGVYFTTQAIRLYHPEIADQTEILVIDNNPDGPAAQELKNLDKTVANYRYIPCGSRNSTAVRDLVFRLANADYVLCLDSHVMLLPGALKRLIEYFEAHPDCPDLLQGPMYAENLKSLHTHFEPVWSKGMYGSWGSDKRADDFDGPPFEIPMQGLGLFACRKHAWVGFSPHFRGFGGEEGYLHEKFRQHGGKALCLPFLRWLHRFARPGGVPYPINWHDRIFNYMVGCRELGIDSEPLKNHFIEHLGKEAATGIFDIIEEELHSPFFYFDAIYCITQDAHSNRWEQMRRRLKALGLEASVRIFKTVDEPVNDQHGFCLSHRTIILEAMQEGLDNVLILEEDTLFLNETLTSLIKSIDELKQQEWDLFYLGGHRQGQKYPFADNCRHLRVAESPDSTHAVAYGAQIFEKIVRDVPDSRETLSVWLRDCRGFDQYLSGISRQFVAEPQVAMKPGLLPLGPDA